jgi:hypothetical protein
MGDAIALGIELDVRLGRHGFSGLNGREMMIQGNGLDKAICRSKEPTKVGCCDEKRVYI